MKADRQTYISFSDHNNIETGPSTDRDLYQKKREIRLSKFYACTYIGKTNINTNFITSLVRNWLKKN